MSSAWDQLQARGRQRIDDALKVHDRICVVAPTGYGKSKTMYEQFSKPGGHVIYTHRRMLCQQLHNDLVDAGIHHGVRAASMPEFYRPDERIQIAMVDTERSQVENKGERDYHDAQWVHLDEAHCNKNDYARRLMDFHRDNGAKIILYTATPVGLKGMADKLVELARNSELRKVGGILPARCFEPDAPDLESVRKVEVSGEFNQKALAKKFHVQQVVASVFEYWLKLNPDARPAIGFTPGVEESMWFVDEFRRRGVLTASLDGDSVYYGEHDVHGERILYTSDQDAREKLQGQSERGEVKIVWNRFVMREGVNWKHLYHCILATAFATDEAYVQSVGRVLRAYPGMDHVVIQDHGGNITRLGNPNCDRIWTLEDTHISRSKERKDRERDGTELQPVVCPQCRRSIPQAAWIAAHKKCPACGFSFKKNIRFVIEADGKLHEVKAGNKIRKKSTTDSGERAFNNMLFGAANSKSARGSTFKQVRARFKKKYGAEFDIRASSTGKTMIVNRTTGEARMLKYAPDWNDATWGFQVRQVMKKGGRDGTGKQDSGNASGDGGGDKGAAELGGLFSERPEQHGHD